MIGVGFVFVDFCFKREKTARRFGEIRGNHHSPNQSPLLGERERPKGGGWRLNVKTENLNGLNYKKKKFRVLRKAFVISSMVAIILKHSNFKFLLFKMTMKLSCFL